MVSKQYLNDFDAWTALLVLLSEVYISVSTCSLRVTSTELSSFMTAVALVLFAYIITPEYVILHLQIRRNKTSLL